VITLRNRHLAAGGVADGKTVAAQRNAWTCFEDQAGQTLHPPKARTGGCRCHTPVVPVSGKGSGRISIAGLVCVKPDRRSRLIYRTTVHCGREGERRSFAETGYIGLLDAAHHGLGGPIVLIWDNLTTHISAAMRQLIAPGTGSTSSSCPPAQPELNPTEAVWSHLNAASATSPSTASSISRQPSNTG
jgi:putative transposase